MKIPLLLGVCAAVLLGAAGSQAADVAAGKTYFKKKCAICHGKTAKGTGNFPSLRDRTAEYLSDRLETYRARGKVGPNSALMYSHAGKLSDEGIANIAAYLAASFGEPSSAASAQADKSEKPDAIACSQEVGEALGECSYQVKRDKRGKITVTAAFSNGFKRKLFFKDGKFLKANMTMSGVGVDTDWSLEDGTHMIRVEGQRYEVPDILIADQP